MQSHFASVLVLVFQAIFPLICGERQHHQFRALPDDLELIVVDSFGRDWMGPHGEVQATHSAYEDLWQTQMRPFDPETNSPDFSKRIYIPKTKKAMLELLIELLDGALDLETLAGMPYLVGRYSLTENDQNANLVIRQLMNHIPIEEMLHMALVGNILTSIGASPRLYTDRQDAGYFNFPLKDFFNDLEGSARNYGLEPANREALEQYSVFESGNVQLPLAWQGNPCGYGSISTFYRDVERLLIELEIDANEHGETIFLSEDPSRQRGLQLDRYYFRRPGIMIVENLNDALLSINIITWQGEGLGDPIPDYESPNHAEAFAQTLRVYDRLGGTETFPRNDDLFLEEQWRDALKALYACYSYQMLLVERIYEIDTSTDVGELMKQQIAFQGMGPMMTGLKDFMSYMIRHGAYPSMTKSHFQFFDDPLFSPKSQIQEAVETARLSAELAGNQEGAALMRQLMTSLVFMVDIPLHFPL